MKFDFKQKFKNRFKSMMDIAPDFIYQVCKSVS